MKAILGDESKKDQWDTLFREFRDRLTSDIGALEAAFSNDKDTWLTIPWTSKLYRFSRDFLEMFDYANTKIIQLSKDINTLEKRMKLAEEELAELEKDRRIRGLSSG
jgi:hypothetical protein